MAEAGVGEGSGITVVDPWTVSGSESEYFPVVNSFNYCSITLLQGEYRGMNVAYVNTTSNNSNNTSSQLRYIM